MGMLEEVCTNGPLDYIKFQISSEKNSYIAFSNSQGKTEELNSGLLEHLLLHLPGAKDKPIYRLELPDCLKGSPWFTKATLSRFLQIVNATEIFKCANDAKDEISQLEESRKYHLDLYVEVNCDFSANGITDISLQKEKETEKPDFSKASSDPSKNELLRAMESRLEVSRKELVEAFHKALGSTCSPKQILDLLAFSQHFGAINLRDLILKYQAIIMKNMDPNPSENDRSNTEDRESFTSEGKMAGIGFSPVKFAQAERQSSTESDDSFESESEEKSCIERSRTVIKSASPRRSASPMRRIQIGRIGSHRAAAITIKSLNFLPSREKVSLNKESSENINEDDEHERPSQRSENTVRMSVQDAISLFERKQRDQALDIQKHKSVAETSVSNKRSVLRRWSAGMGDSFNQSIQDTSSGNDVNNIPDKLPEPELELVEVKSDNMTEMDALSSAVETMAMADGPVDDPVDSVMGKEIEDRLGASLDWNLKKEAELNQLVLEMLESKQSKYSSSGIDKSSKNTNAKKSNSLDRCREKRDSKLRKQNKEKYEDSDSQFNGKRKIEMGSKYVLRPAKIDSFSSTQKNKKSEKLHGNSSLLVTSKQENSKPPPTKKATTRASSIPPVRKSWPSSPSSKTTLKSPAKTSGVQVSTGMNPNRLRLQQLASSAEPRPKVERSLEKVVKESQVENNIVSKDLKEKKG